jgi:ribosomal protein L11 methyltransferase
VDGELAEAVAEILARFIPDGVVVESTSITAEADDSEGRAVGPLRVFGYLPVNETLEASRRELEEALWYLGRIRPLPTAQYKAISQIDWSEAWKEHFRPIAVGRRLMILPSWIDQAAGERLSIHIDPGMAFGTGTHPSTQLCLELIEEEAVTKPRARWDAIDIGCGSGILAIAALKLGARRALAVDIDEEAVLAAGENALANQVAGQLEIGKGSLSEILAGGFSLQKADLVLANILAPVLVKMLDERLGELLQQEGRLVLAGILAEQSEQVEAALDQHELAVDARRQSGDWIAFRARRKSDR